MCLLLLNAYHMWNTKLSVGIIMHLLAGLLAVLLGGNAASAQEMLQQSNSVALAAAQVCATDSDGPA